MAQKVKLPKRDTLCDVSGCVREAAVTDNGDDLCATHWLKLRRPASDLPKVSQGQA